MMMIKMRTGKLEKHAKAVSGQFSHNAHAFAFACIPTPIRVGIVGGTMQTPSHQYQRTGNILPKEFFI